jgi:hypothetical protein
MNPSNQPEPNDHICPYCNHMYWNLSRHTTRQHPDKQNDSPKEVVSNIHPMSGNALAIGILESLPDSANESRQPDAHRHDTWCAELPLKTNGLDAQAEVELRQNIKDLIFNGYDRFDVEEVLDKIMALHEADKSAVVVEAKDDLLYDLDEIDNKPWRVFRQLARIMPEYADCYWRYEAFYSYGGGLKVEALITEFEQTDDFKDSGFPEMIARLQPPTAGEGESL